MPGRTTEGEPDDDDVPPVWTGAVGVATQPGVRAVLARTTLACCLTRAALVAITCEPAPWLRTICSAAADTAGAEPTLAATAKAAQAVKAVIVTAKARDRYGTTARCAAV